MGEGCRLGGWAGRHRFRSQPGKIRHLRRRNLIGKVRQRGLAGWQKGKELGGSH